MDIKYYLQFKLFDDMGEGTKASLFTTLFEAPITFLFVLKIIK